MLGVKGGVRKIPPACSLGSWAMGPRLPHDTGPGTVPEPHLARAIPLHGARRGSRVCQEPKETHPQTPARACGATAALPPLQGSHGFSLTCTSQEGRRLPSTCWLHKK